MGAQARVLPSKERRAKEIRREPELHESEGRYRSLVEAAREIICAVDLKGRFLSFNPAFETLTGWSGAEWIGRPFSEILHAEDVPACQAAFEAGMRHAAGALVRHRLLRRDGSWLRVESSGTPYVLAGRVIGVIGVVRDDTHRQNAEDELRRSQRLLEQAEEIRRALLNRLIALQENERARLSRELHDGTGQALAALLMGLRRIESAPSLQEVRRAAARERALASQALDELGRLARGLRPIALDDLGLRAALERHASDQGWLFGFEVTLDADGLGSRRLPREIETALYRVTQEALANAARHAAPRHVRIGIGRDHENLRLTIVDDGCGFEAERVPAGVGHLGLHGIRERAALIGGRAEIRSKAGTGTSISVTVPLRRATVAGTPRRRGRPATGGRRSR